MTPILFAVLELLSVCIIIFGNEIIKTRFFSEIRKTEAKVFAVFENIRYYLSLKETNTELVEENLKLREEIFALKAEIEEYQAKGYSMSDSLVYDGYSIIPGKILKNSLTQRINHVIINKGSMHGVKPDMGVITQNGVLGIVTNVSENASSVLSILSKNTGISAKIKSTGTIGPMIWEGRDTKHMCMPEIPHHIEISEGDTVCTSGYSSVFPPDIELGTIESISMTKAGFKKAVVRLFEDYSSIHFVSIVNNGKTEEINTLMEENRKK